MKMKDLKKKISKKIKSFGFDVLGFAKPIVEEKTKKQYLDFLNKNHHGEMRWLERHFEKKINPKKVWDKVKSIIVIGYNYSPEKNPLIVNKEKNVANISVYAQNQDYHDVIKKKLRKIQFWLEEECKIESKVFVDTSPILEKYFAQKANLGWQGKHTNLVSKTYGSWLFLSEIFLSIEIKNDLEESSNCGTCNECQEICPTNALLNAYKINARKCISYLTIEYKGPIPLGLRRKIGNKVYGCDDCLSICPWNKFSKKTNEPAFLSQDNKKNFAFFLRFDNKKFKEYFANSPIKRIGWLRFLRNIIIATGNSKNKNIENDLYKYLYHENPIIRASCIWSLNQILDKKRIEKIKKEVLKKEKNRYVLFELSMIN
ncbi:MAG: tRNA epoxyqueuosine(34) reductase QueG [Pseudomonadota bacterium]|nr:tRNA epoxyqueuosine(34) reductase QueG [Pseudomonadota bacterium]